jgi:hypothetical protein
MEKESLSRKEIQRRPYVLLLDPTGQRGVAYNAKHRVVAEESSPMLIAWALKHHTQTSDWDDEKDKHWQRERAAWMPAGSLSGWRLIWLRNGQSTDDHIRATPLK